jgi:uncharacterized protein (TIGR03083 family)
MSEVGSAYAAGRQRISALVLEPAAAAVPVPACPEWTVHNVLSHVAGICADILAGRLDGVTTPAWTDAQVRVRRDVLTADVVAEWVETAPQIEAMVDQFGSAGQQLVADLTTHEHDIRGALGRPGARDSDGVAIGVEFLLTMGLEPTLAERGLPALELVIDDDKLVLGTGSPAARLDAHRFEFLRAWTGRRSVGQIRSMDWSGDVDPYLAAFAWGPFTPAAVDIIE